MSDISEEWMRVNSGNCCEAGPSACDCGCGSASCGCGCGTGCNCGSGCGCGSSGARKFFTKEEKVRMLDEYKKHIEKELAGINEKIKALKKAG